MLRTRLVSAGGQRFVIANLQLRPRREFQEAVDGFLAAKPGDVAGSASRMEEATKRVVLASLKRADPGCTMEALEDLDGDDLNELFLAVMKWTGEIPGQAGQGKPAGEPPSP